MNIESWTSDRVAIKALMRLRAKTRMKLNGEIIFTLPSYMEYELAITNLALIWAGIEKV